MLSIISPICSKTPLVLSEACDSTSIPGKFNQYLHSFQRDALRTIQNQFVKKLGVVLNTNKGYGKTVQTVLFLSALAQSHGCLPSVIICPIHRIQHWKFHIHVWSENAGKNTDNDDPDDAADISVINQDDLDVIMKHKWQVVVIDDLDESKIINVLKIVRCHFKVWIKNGDLWNNLPLLHTIGNAIGMIDKSLTKEEFLKKYSYTNKPYNEAVKSFQLLNVLCEPWLVKYRGTKPDFIDTSVYNHYFQKWKKEQCPGIQEEPIEDCNHDVETFTNELVTSTSPDKSENVQGKRETKDATGLKIKKSKVDEKFNNVSFTSTLKQVSSKRVILTLKKVKQNDSHLISTLFDDNK